METSEITVVAPTKNEARNLPKFLNSLPPEVQLILVDASSDGTPELALRLRQERTLVQRSPARIAEARNIGAGLARTKWLLFTDADVAFEAAYFTYLAGLNKVGAIYGPKWSDGPYESFYRSFSRWQARFDRLGIPAVSGSNFLVDRQTFDSIGGFDARLLVNEDTEIGYRLKRAGFPIHFDPALRVIPYDHRRLAKGTLRKNLHTLARCTLIYLNLFHTLWRGNDWGYWS